MAKQKIGAEITLRGMFDHGRSELAAALLRHNDGHVMYMKGQDGQDQQNAPAQKPFSMDDLREAGKTVAKEAEKAMKGQERSQGRER